MERSEAIAVYSELIDVCLKRGIFQNKAEFMAAMDSYNTLSGQPANEAKNMQNDGHESTDKNDG